MKFKMKAIIGFLFDAIYFQLLTLPAVPSQMHPEP